MLEFVMEYTATSWVGVGFRPDSVNESCQARDMATDPEAEAEAEPESEAEAGSEPEPEAESEPEPESEPETVGETDEGMHPMDCQDIYIGTLPHIPSSLPYPLQQWSETVSNVSATTTRATDRPQFSTRCRAVRTRSCRRGRTKSTG